MANTLWFKEKEKKEERKNKKTTTVIRKMWDIDKKYSIEMRSSDDPSETLGKDGLVVVAENVFELIEKVEQLEKQVKELKEKLGDK